MPGASLASRFSGESVRVGRSEASSNGRPRGMVIAFGLPKCTEPGLQASWLKPSTNARKANAGACNSAAFASRFPANVNQRLTFSIHIRLTGTGESRERLFGTFEQGFGR